MDTNKNLYTIIYATVLVVIVAVVLTLAVSLLRDRQQRNIEVERMQMILQSVHLAQQAPEVSDKDVYIEREYARYIKDSVISGEKEKLTLHICTLDSKERVYIIPVSGTGLWGGICGYLALKEDFDSIYGAIFDHSGETPGLGAEIATSAFSGQFDNKKIFENGKFVSVEVVKGGADPGDYHQVDAVSGGTITSHGVQNMLYDSIEKYLGFFESKLDLTTTNL